ncbi:hypothetical protein AB4Y36_01530 [Paraburkholderia sp. BR10936]|uniref:hypothetical protein n=1 Tax=Paraburkholderia sp. BR10936 TaxID=3236993 RepID=UPI0034D35FD8
MTEFISLRAVLERIAHQHGTLKAAAKALCELLQPFFDEMHPQGIARPRNRLWLVDGAFGAKACDIDSARRAWKLVIDVANLGDFERTENGAPRPAYDAYGFKPEILDVLAETPTPSQDPPPKTIAATVPPVPSPTVDETPEQRRARVAAVVAKCSGNKTAAGRELGISRQRVDQILASNPVAPPPSDPFNLSSKAGSKRH